MSDLIIFCILFTFVAVVMSIPQRRFIKFFSALNFRGESNKRLPRYLSTKKLNNFLSKTEFKSRIPFERWEKIRPELELFYRKKIYDMKQSRENVRVLSIYFIDNPLPSYIEWRDNFMEEGSKFSIGEGYEGKEIWDVAALPHGLIAGATGSGKTGVLRCIIHQAISKKWNVSVLDFKGGGDYNSIERESAKFRDLENGYGPILVTDPKEALQLLVCLSVEVKGRLAAFKEIGVANIGEYNASGNGHFVPWLLVIDEAAEILDVKPKSKAEKEMYAEIDDILRTLARISRAAGVHILMGFIRPDATVLDGQIKNNLLWRMCGYFADPAASRIVLDNAKAVELPPDIKGRFIVNDKEVQAYYLPVPKSVAKE